MIRTVYPRALSLLVALLSPAFTFATPRIAVVDIQKVIDSSAAGRQAKATMQADMQTRQQKLFQLGKEIEQMRSDLTKQSSLLSKEALEAKQSALASKEREAQRKIDDQRQELRMERDKTISKLVERIDSVVKNVADKELFDIVIERDPDFVLYAKDTMDISAKVAKNLN